MTGYTYNSGEEAEEGDLVARNSRGSKSALTNTNAEEGAKATVTKLIHSYEDDYVEIKWDETDPRWNNQNHGGYSASSFNLVSRKSA